MGGENEKTVSSRALNPLSLDESVSDVFLDKRQAQATTATRLFRNPEIFRALREYVLQEYFTNDLGRGISIWSAGCSSGAETYSLAMAAVEEFVKNRQRPSVRVFGTDINRDRLAEAAAGVYLAPNTLLAGDGYDKLIAKYAAREGPHIRMGQAIRMHVKFGLFDMRKKPRSHTFDFIVCNHVLQYYDLTGQLHILRNLAAVLRPGGYMYIEGITANAVEPSGLRRVSGCRNLYLP